MLLLSSASFKHLGEIPTEHTCEGDDTSPPLAWTGVHPDAKSLALIVDDPDAPDPDAPKITWVHWVLYNIPPSASGLPGAIAAQNLPPGAKEGLNDWKRSGWGGPCPPIGRHRYFFKLYVLDEKLPDLQTPTKATLERVMKDHVIAQAELIGTYLKKETEVIYLVRFAEAGRDAQRGKLPRDLEAVLRARQPGARFVRATGRLVVEIDGDARAAMAGLHGIVSWSECVRCARDEIAARVVERVLASGARSFAVRARSRTLASRVGAAVVAATAARVNLDVPEIEIGIDLILDNVYLWTERCRPAAAAVVSRSGRRFLADHMLGRLARWMRLCGFDVAYARDEPDSAVLRRAQEEQRLLLTRDAALAAVAGLRIRANEASAQLREVLDALGLRVSREAMFRRCTICNSPVEEVAKEAVRARVPAAAFATHDRFTRCPSCDRIYWQGGHYQLILSALENLHGSE